MTLEEKFAGMGLNEPLKIEIEGKEVELEVGTDDIIPLMSMGTSQGDIEEEDVQKLTEVFRTVLYRTYLPYWDDVRGQEPDSLTEKREKENEEVKEYIDGLLVRKLPVLVEKIIGALGWNDDTTGVAGQDFPASPSQ